ncbi:dockerin type I domain-containing protein [Blastopirellula sp. J2-11]|uniref:dockerin type I domain-containing protein n=1 Tax=Blastopirellula sp. J2-11 TaxID=2943192 RepID=UPI0021C8FCAA|nr:dockerin type I domain-containing protein [Blastopirellula sp. J2-11]UUO08811.1 dockerin type I domain-containing protein [Blastopirellula sp. J2-11]
MTSHRRFRKGRTRRDAKSTLATLRLESLESRINFSGVPLGAAPTDTGEFMLGDVSVTVVFLESMQTGGVDPSSEDWTEAEIDASKAKIDEALQWWVDTLELQNTVHELNFQINYQYADSPVPTRYEPITRAAAEFDKWAGDFLDYVGAERSDDIIQDIRLFNDSRRVAEGTNWAFTIFVADASNDLDGYWKNPGGIAGGFSVAGGAFMAIPNSRPAISIAHETAHQFWAMDEYLGSKGYYEHRGYYDTQNTNALVDRPADAPPVVDSLMLSNMEMQRAYDNHTSSTAMFESIGWKDSDGDGIFDVLDQPLSLKGSGALDADSLEYHFVGQASVGVLPNLNTAGTQQSFNQFLQHDMTINTVAAVQYRIDGGEWRTAETYDEYVADIDIRIELPSSALHVVEIRAIDATGAIVSDVFAGSTTEITATTEIGATGFLFDDQNRNGVFDPGEVGLSGWSVELVDSQNAPVATQIVVEPDNFGAGDQIDDLVPGASFSAFGENIIGAFPNVFSQTNAAATTGSRVFGYYRSTVDSTGHFSEWNAQQQLRVDLDWPVSRVSIDAIGAGAGSIGRLEAYDAQNNLIGRYTTAELAAGQAETMLVETDSPQIAYILVAGQLSTSVRLDNFVAGQAAAVETDPFGAFALPMDVAGDYQLRITPPDGDAQTYVIAGSAEATFALQPLTGFRFAIKPDSLDWRNPYSGSDINDDGQVDLTDFEVAMAELLAPIYSVADQLDGDHQSPAPFLDANGDGVFNVLDAVRVLETIAIAEYSFPSEEEAVLLTGNAADENDSLDEPETSTSDLDASSLHVAASSVTPPDAALPYVTVNSAPPWSASYESTSLDGDWGLGNLSADDQPASQDFVIEGEAVVADGATFSGSPNSVVTDDRILADAADDIFLAMFNGDEEEEIGELDPFFAPWGLLD